MALNLDTRQRAMLQEMGITLWWPKAAAPSPVPAMPAPSEAVAAVATASIAPPAAAPQVAPAPTPVATPAAPVVAVRVEAEAAAAAIAATPVVADWHMAPAVQAFPSATGGHASDAWLVIWECPTPATPLEGETGKLLHNMLRALRLHHSAHVWIAGMQRPGHEALPVAALPAEPVTWHALPEALPATIARTQPARILVLGMHAARAVLGSQEALGRLRAQIHQIHSVPAVVSYDPAYLLRSPHAKPAAWADLCRAHALHPPSAA